MKRRLLSSDGIMRIFTTATASPSAIPHVVVGRAGKRVTPVRPLPRSYDPLEDLVTINFSSAAATSVTWLGLIGSTTWWLTTVSIIAALACLCIALASTARVYSSHRASKVRPVVIVVKEWGSR